MKFCIKCIEIDTNMLLLSLYDFAKHIPKEEYTSMYKNSGNVEKLPIICNKPNNNPDIIINNLSLFIILEKLNLKTVSSTNGAYNVDKISIINGIFLNISLRPC